jgi:hypothetical protein
MEVKNKQLAAAIELYKSAETDEVRTQAINIIEAMANSGDVSACLILGVNYDPSKEKGFVERDEVKALEWYKKAAELGDAKGANEAAILCYRGSPDVQDKESAAKYIKMAVDMDPDNEVYKKNYGVIVPKVTEPEIKPEDDGGEDNGAEDPPAEDIPDGKGKVGEKPVIDGICGNLLFVNIAFLAVIIAVGAAGYFLKMLSVCLIPLVVLIAVAALLNVSMSKCHISVTNRRISGRISYQRLIDMPLDCVTSVGTCVFGGVKVTAASCRCAFYLVKNADEVRDAIANLLIERQENSLHPTSVVYQEVTASDADELKKLGELLDAGIITKDEFDELKGDIIGE